MTNEKQERLQELLRKAHSDEPLDPRECREFESLVMEQTSERGRELVERESIFLPDESPAVI